jgi:hypothetical protein
LFRCTFARVLCGAFVRPNEKTSARETDRPEYCNAWSVGGIAWSGPGDGEVDLDFRAQSGPFKRVDDLLSVHRISQKKLDKLRPYVTVSTAHHPPANQPAKQPAKHPQ